MNHQDWKIQNVGRQSGSSLTSAEIKLKQQQAMRSGNTVSYQKYKTGSNNPPNSKKLDDATESTKIDKLKCGQDIMKARAAKKMTRKQLAGLINKKEEVLASFENNNALATPANKKILNDIKRKLNIV